MAIELLPSESGMVAFRQMTALNSGPSRDCAPRGAVFSRNGNPNGQPQE
jgi:hypothetical protein